MRRNAEKFSSFALARLFCALASRRLVSSRYVHLLNVLHVHSSLLLQHVGDSPLFLNFPDGLQPQRVQYVPAQMLLLPLAVQQTLHLPIHDTPELARAVERLHASHVDVAAVVRRVSCARAGKQSEARKQ